MSFREFFILIGIVIGLMIVYKYADRYIKKLDRKLVKIINWIGFTLVVIGVAGNYIFHIGIMTLVSFVGIVIFFLFYNYDKTEKEKKE